MTKIKKALKKFKKAFFFLKKALQKFKKKMKKAFWLQTSEVIK